MKTKTFSIYKKDNSGFTLVELIAVIAVIGILLAIAVPSVLGFTSSSRSQADEASAKILTGAARMYKTESPGGVWPAFEPSYTKIGQTDPHLGPYLPNEIEIQQSGMYFVFHYPSGSFIVSDTPNPIEVVELPPENGEPTQPPTGPSEPGEPSQPPVEPPPTTPTEPTDPPGEPTEPVEPPIDPDQKAVDDTKNDLINYTISGSTQLKIVSLMSAGKDGANIAWSVTSGNAATVSGSTLTLAYSNNTTRTATLRATITKNDATPQILTFQVETQRQGQSYTYSIQ